MIPAARLLRSKQTGRSFRGHGPFRTVTTYAWGNADHGQLGLPLRQLQDEKDTFGKQSSLPQAIPLLKGMSIAAAATSSSHSAFVNSDGNLLVCGYNGQGQLGLKDLDNRSEPTIVPTLPTLRAVACGARHTVVLARDGLVFTFGSNSSGQLGLTQSTSDDATSSTRGYASEPQLVMRLVEDGRRIVDVAAGEDFSIALSDTGRVFTWGAAHYGALGHEQSPSISHLAAFLFQQTPVFDEHPRLVRALASRRIVRISAGRRHAMAIDDSGAVFAWGCGRHFVLGTQNEKDVFEPVRSFTSIGPVEKVACGTAHSLVLTKSGTVFSVGENDHGCLGIGTRGPFDVHAEPVFVQHASPARDIAAGWHISAVVMADGSVRTWGCAQAGALGVEGGYDLSIPQDIGIKAKSVFIGGGGMSVVAIA